MRFVRAAAVLLLATTLLLQVSCGTSTSQGEDGSSDTVAQETSDSVHRLSEIRVYSFFEEISKIKYNYEGNSANPISITEEHGDLLDSDIFYTYDGQGRLIKRSPRDGELFPEGGGGFSFFYPEYEVNISYADPDYFWDSNENVGKSARISYGDESVETKIEYNADGWPLKWITGDIEYNQFFYPPRNVGVGIPNGIEGDYGFPYGFKDNHVLYGDEIINIDEYSDDSFIRCSYIYEDDECLFQCDDADYKVSYVLQQDMGPVDSVQGWISKVSGDTEIPVGDFTSKYNYEDGDTHSKTTSVNYIGSRVDLKTIFGPDGSSIIYVNDYDGIFFGEYPSICWYDNDYISVMATVDPNGYPDLAVELKLGELPLSLNVDEYFYSLFKITQCPMGAAINPTQEFSTDLGPLITDRLPEVYFNSEGLLSSLDYGTGFYVDFLYEDSSATSEASAIGQENNLSTSSGREALVAELRSTADFMGDLERLGDDVIPLMYNVDPEDYTSALVYCGTAAIAEEIAVFQAVDDAAAERLLTAVQNRVDNQIEVYKDYNPGLVKMFENSIVIRTGNTVVLVVCYNSQSARNIVDQFCRQQDNEK